MLLSRDIAKSEWTVDLRLYWSIIMTILIGVSISLYYDDYIWIPPVIAAGAVGVCGLIFYPRQVLYGLFLVIPISGEVELPGGLGTDLPGEIILLALTALTLVVVCMYGLHKRLWHPITLIIALQLLWLVIASLFAEYPMYAIKFTIAKLWYILPIYVLPHYLLRSHLDINRVLDCFIIGVLIGGAYFFIQHGLEGFDFEARVTAGKPLWRNHVNYACTLVCTLPILCYRYYTTGYKRYLVGCLFVLFCIYFAYARVAYLCIAAGIFYTFILRLKLTVPIIIAALIVVAYVSYTTTHDEAYVRYAPEYERAITQDDFGSKVGTTFNGQDISTMERVHRWVAGIRMIGEDPLTGVGPSNFYSTYKPFTVFSFETYVSDNPEHSGIHNYYLMTLVEQGWIGLLLLLSLLIYALYAIQQVYHRADDHRVRLLLIMTGSILAMIITLNVINDMIEVIKIGSLLFFLLFVIVFVTDEVQVY